MNPQNPKQPPKPQPGKAPEPLIPQYGGYRNLKSFQVAQLVYDVTVRFCDRYIEKRSRTHDQMVQAAAFEQEGGFTERLYRIRQDRRRSK